MSTVFQDVRYALRVMVQQPGFTIAVILTLALGIGANTAIFSILNTVLLRPLPYPDPDRLVKITFNDPGVGLHDVQFSYPEFDDVRSRAGVFEEVSVAWPSSGNLTGAREPKRLELLAVSPNYFSMLGAAPQIGRLFDHSDVARGFAQAAVISDGLWRRSYASDPAVVGQKLRIDNDPYTIVGVLPPTFHHPGRTVAGNVEVWLTAGFSADPFSPGRSERELPGAIGRLKRGLSLEKAQAELDILADHLRIEYPNDYPAQAKWSIGIQSLQRSLSGNVRPMLEVLMGAVLLIILIASVNIANLLLVRASRRQGEMAVRIALGASRARIMRQVFTEALVLSFMGGIAGICVAFVALRFLLRFVPSNIPRLNEVHMDWTMLLFALVMAVLTGICFGLAPAIQAGAADVYAAIREAGRGSGTGARTAHVRDLLIVSELGLAVLLTIGAGLLLRTFWGLLERDPGFNPTHVVAASIWLPVPNDPKADPYDGLGPETRFIRELLRNASSIPGVQTTGVTSVLPVTGPAKSMALSIEGRTIGSSENLSAETIRVSPDFFRVMQSSLIQGRFFDETDDSSKPLTAIIDQTTRRRFWPDESPIGKRLKLGRGKATPWTTVVGVIKDIKHDGLDSDGVPHLYVPIYQRVGKAMTLVMRTSLQANGLESQIREAVKRVDPNLPVFNIRSMTDVIDSSLASRRFSAELVGAFSVIAVLLASIGIYGLLTYVVAQRLHEIGVRMVVGAAPGDILRLVLRRAVVLAGIGILAGLFCAAALAPMLSGVLYGVRAWDARVFIGVALLLLAVSLLASSLPAYRAAKVHPGVALRD